MSSKKNKSASDETQTTSLTNDGSFGDDAYAMMDDDKENLEVASNADTFSLAGSASEGVSVYYGKENCTPWNISWSGRIVNNKIFKVR